MAIDGYSAYKQIDVTTASPATLTTMLFDGALKAIKKARLLHENGNRQGFVTQTLKASDIVGQLYVSLDMSQGELPRQLGDIYSYCLRLLGEATLDDVAKLDEVEMHIGRIANAWKEVTRKDAGQDGPKSIGGLAA
jgi:flagellar protein FliS